MVLQHLIARTEAELRWHSDLAARLPKIAADFANGVGGPQPSDPGLKRPDQKRPDQKRTAP
jgi:hypothetical protein